MANAVLHNNNGVDYKVLGLCEFRGADVEYYKNSWQNYRFGLLASGEHSFVVASMVGDSEWGNGSYFEDKADAEKYYNEKVREYKRG